MLRRECSCRCEILQNILMWYSSEHICGIPLNIQMWDSSEHSSEHLRLLLRTKFSLFRIHPHHNPIKRLACNSKYSLERNLFTAEQQQQQRQEVNVHSTLAYDILVDGGTPPLLQTPHRSGVFSHSTWEEGKICENARVVDVAEHVFLWKYKLFCSFLATVWWDANRWPFFAVLVFLGHRNLHPCVWRVYAVFISLCLQTKMFTSLCLQTNSLK